jgi:hypothetical protein
MSKSTRRVDSPYYEFVRALAQKLPSQIVDFSVPRKKPPLPTQANSNFIINKNLGDWGEDLVRRSILATTKDYVVARYGIGGEKVFGEEGFAEEFRAYQRNLDIWGKRPDLLIFKKDDYPSTDFNLSNKEDSEIIDLVRKAILGIEVRSSNFLSKKYVAGKSAKFDVLSFQIKVEDIVIVLKWIENTGVPHFYVQVPQDEVYRIGFHRALKIVTQEASDEDEITYSIERVPKNQFKNTIKIPFSEKAKVGDITDPPQINAVRRELDNGRLIFGVKFSGGNLVPLADIWNKIFRRAEQLKDNPPDVS